MSAGQITAPAVQGPFVVWEGLFSSEELNAIERYGDSLRLEKAELTGDGKPGYDANIRRSRVAWLERNAQSEALYQRMHEIVRVINRQFFQFELSMLAPMQYAVYAEAQQAHFDWHTDYGRERGHEQHQPRKLSLSVQLSDPAQYQGGELQAHVRSGIDTATTARGAVIAFPSYVLHRVTPITAGTRKSLVLWSVGPEYR
jgi:PKHD-type hydroxylase